MKFWRWFVASSLLAVSLNSCRSELLNFQLGKSVDGEVVKISYGDKGNATGFFVPAPDQVCSVLTARHALPASGKLKLQTSDNKLWEPANIQRFPNQDLAVVTFKPGESNCPYQAFRLGNFEQVKLGDSIKILGFSQSADSNQLASQSLSGAVTAIENLPDGYGISYKTPANKGMVGAPVLNQAGEVIAVNGRNIREIARLAELKGAVPPQQLSTANSNQGSNSAVEVVNWGIPINIYMANAPIIPTEAVANSTAPKSAAEWLKIGNDFYISQQYEAALKGYDQALKIEPKYVLAWLYKGSLLLELKRYQEAVSNYDRALQFKPDSTVALSNRGLALDHIQKYEEAIASFDKAIKLQPNAPEVWTGRCYALAKLQKYQDAIASCEVAIKIQPEYSDAWNNRGYVLNQVQQYDQALLSFEKAIEFEPNNAEAWANKGLALDHLQQNAEAIAAYDQAIKLQPNYAQAWYGRGNALFSLNKPKDALAAYNKAISLKPNYQQALNSKSAVLAALQRNQDNVAAEGQTPHVKVDNYNN
ncbi:tetratricopeptide repeat-containing S1 family peptidase [Crinalium epipsammum]|uniref:tetratricopeptide repeat-containing S1 family peptidase n=1 Tax=Crinalium epipsammum TaxID=241425 RepID=UPI000687EBA8|nr:tetratricopeptide repeat-containing serine protease family protein [Crinalium epipsammum]